MAKFVVRIYVMGQCVWGDNDVEAADAAEARAIGEREFLTPFTAFDGLKPDEAAAMRKMEETAAGLREYPRTVEAQRSRARARA